LLDCAHFGGGHFTTTERERRNPQARPLAGASGWYWLASRAGGVCDAIVRRVGRPTADTIAARDVFIGRGVDSHGPCPTPPPGRAAVCWPWSRTTWPLTIT